jgi:hypothetical protein
MSDAKSLALKYATEIVVAKVSSTAESTYKETGEHTANFFEAVYNKIYEIANNQD